MDDNFTVGKRRREGLDRVHARGRKKRNPKRLVSNPEYDHLLRVRINMPIIQERIKELELLSGDYFGLEQKETFMKRGVMRLELGILYQRDWSELERAVANLFEFDSTGARFMKINEKYRHFLDNEAVNVPLEGYSDYDSVLGHFEPKLQQKATIKVPSRMASLAVVNSLPGFSDVYQWVCKHYMDPLGLQLLYCHVLHQSESFSGASVFSWHTDTETEDQTVYTVVVNVTGGGSVVVDTPGGLPLEYRSGLSVVAFPSACWHSSVAVSEAQGSIYKIVLFFGVAPAAVSVRDSETSGDGL